MEFVRTGCGFEAYNAAGEVIAEITYHPSDDARVVVADHTFVDPSLRGQGVAKQLVDTLIDAMRSEGKLIRATCPYIVTLFGRDRSYDGINADKVISRQTEH